MCVPSVVYLLNAVDIIVFNFKVRKLEFILADAILKGSSCVITCGGLQSNHCRATAVAARRLGLKCHLLLRSHNLVCLLLCIQMGSCDC